jgi:UDP-N-acetylglucosamine 2-epimerase (non-hydrolysing)
MIMSNVKKIKILNIVGARPNFIKISPLLTEQKRHPDAIEPILLHTGQHYSPEMYKEIFDDLELPAPDIYLDVGSGTHAAQTANIMLKFEPVLLETKPDVILVVGDVNSTLACSLVASKLGIKIAHIEAGLRSGNWRMPEEINRVLTDRLSDYLYTSEEDAENNLIKEGIAKDKIHFVGNVMIDTLENFKNKAAARPVKQEFGLDDYILMTMHRPENVDVKEKLELLLDIVAGLQYPVVFPMHPRTSNLIANFGLKQRFDDLKNLKIIRPLGYLDFLNLQMNAKLVMTDSGGVQEETTALGIPCLTLRSETERPMTVTCGTNKVIGLNKDAAIKSALDILKQDSHRICKKPPLWDGHAAERIVADIIRSLASDE